MPNRKAEIIPEPKKETRNVIITKAAPAFIGTGDLSVLCGHCGTILISNIASGQVRGMVIKCHGCGKFNDTAKACL
jgi:hypothetical protein